MDKQLIIQKAITHLMAIADGDFVSKKEAIEAGSNLHNLMIEMRDQPQGINVPQSELKYVPDTNVVNMESNKSAEEVPQWIKVKPDGSNLPDPKDYSVMYELGYIQDGRITASPKCRLHPADFTTLHKNKSFSYFRALRPLENVRQVLKSTAEMHNELQSRITQLEKQNSELMEALGKIIATQSKVTSFGSSAAYREAHGLAEQALNPKDNG